MLIFIELGESGHGEEFSISRVPCVGEMIDTKWGWQEVTKVVHMRYDADKNEPQAIVFVGG